MSSKTGLYVEERFEGRGLVRMALEDILLFRAEDKFVVAYGVTKSLLLTTTLKALEEKFGDFFVRVHREHLVSKDSLAYAYLNNQGGVLYLKGREQTVRVSRRCMPALRQAAAERSTPIYLNTRRVSDER